MTHLWHIVSLYVNHYRPKYQVFHGYISTSSTGGKCLPKAALYGRSPGELYAPVACGPRHPWGTWVVKVCTACSTGCCHDLAECLLQQTALHKSCATTCCRLAHQQSLHLSPSQGRSFGEFCDLLQWHWKIFSTEVKVWGPLPDFLHFKSHSPKPIFF